MRWVISRGRRGPADTSGASSRVSARMRRRGFTMIELLVTLTILAIGVLALAQLMPAGSRSMNRSRSKTSGTVLAAQKLEDLKSLDWTSASLVSGTSNDQTGKYARSWTVTDDTPLIGTKKVTVTVSWPSSNGTRSTVLSTYLTRLTN